MIVGVIQGRSHILDEGEAATSSAEEGSHLEPIPQTSFFPSFGREHARVALATWSEFGDTTTLSHVRQFEPELVAEQSHE
jgi:hypothetical protein